MQRHQSWLVWGSLLMSLFIYGAMPYLIPPLPHTPPEPLRVLVMALAVVALLEGLATLAMRHFLLLGPVRAGTLDPETPAGAGRVWTLRILCWVLSVSIGIYGLVLFFLYRQTSLLYPFLGAAAALLIIHAPRPLPTPERSSRDLARPDVKIG
jgi:hypothetical protein